MALAAKCELACLGATKWHGRKERCALLHNIDLISFGGAKGLDLQFDHVAAARFTDDGRPDLRVVLVERADVARIVEVVMHCLMVCTDHGAGRPEPDSPRKSEHGCADSTPTCGDFLLSLSQYGIKWTTFGHL